MKRLFVFLLTCILVFSLLPLSSTSAKDTWRGLHSRNFYLIGNAGEKDIRQVATRLEQFREAFTKVFPGTRAAASQPITVIVFKNHSSFEPYMPVHNGKITQVSGYFQPSDEGRYILLTSEMEGDYPFSVIFHEFVHNLTEDSSRPLPTWLSEGMAELYSTFKVNGDRKINLGLPVVDHIYELRQSRFLTIPELFAIKTDSNEYNEGNKRSIFYAESWALVHFLIMGNNGKRVPQLQKFIVAINSGASIDESYRQSFDIDYATMQKELQDYVQQNKYRYVTYELNEKLDFDKNAQTAPVTEAEAEYQLGSVLSMQMRTDSEPHLRNAVALDPNLAEAQALLGKVLMFQGKVTEAKEHLERAVSGNSKSYLTHYYYAWALSKEGSDNKKRLVDSFPTDNIPQIRAELAKAIELNPGFIESYHMLGFLNLIENKDIDETIQLFNKILVTAPGNENLNFILGQLYMRKTDFDTARKTLEPLTRTAKTAEMRASATNMLNQVNQMADSYARYQENLNKAYTKTDDKSSNVIDTTNTSKTSNPPTLRRRGEETEPAGPVLCVHFPGEQVKGLLTEMECTSKAIVLFVESEGKTVKFETTDPSKMKMITCGLAGGEDFTCGRFAKPRLVTLFYDKLANPKKGIEGNPTAVVFMQP